MKLTPLGKNIIARQVEEQQTTASGIVLPDYAEKKDVVLLDVRSIGKLVEEVEPGDRILARRQFLDPIDLGDGTKTYSLEADDVLAIVYDNGTGGIGTSVTDTAGNTYTRVVNDPNAANAFTLEVWEAHDCVGGVVPTITWYGSASVKAKLAFAELDQVSPYSPLDGTSTPLDKVQDRVDTTNSTTRSSAPTSPAPAQRVGMIEVFAAFIGWNDTRTISFAPSPWTGLVQLSGGSTNLGIGMERRSSEVKNVSGAQGRASFVMSASGTQPAAVASLAFFRDGVMTSTNQDGYVDNVEGVVTAYTNTASNYVYKSSASAPTGGTGSSEVSQAFAFFSRFYPKSGATIGDAIDCNFSLIEGYDDGLGYFAFFVSTFNNGQVSDTLTVADENTAESNGPDELAIDANAWGEKTITLDKAADFNDDGTTALKLTQRGDGHGSPTGNYMNVGDYFANSPMYLILALTYPSLAVPVPRRLPRLANSPRLTVQRVRR